MSDILDERGTSRRHASPPDRDCGRQCRFGLKSERVMRYAAMRLATGALFVLAGLVGIPATQANADSNLPQPSRRPPHGGDAGAADAARAYREREIRRLFAGRPDDRFGELRQNDQALGRRERAGAADAARAYRPRGVPSPFRRTVGRSLRGATTIRSSSGTWRAGGSCGRSRTF